MNERDLYNPKDVQRLTGVSASALRNYSDTYARYLSTEATETPRKFTESDVKLVAYVVDCTKRRALTHEQVLDNLQTGELEQFEWQAPEPASSVESGDYSGDLVPVERLQAFQMVAQQAEKREQTALEQLAHAQARIEQLSQELGQAKGELQGFQRAQYRAPKWWRSLFGGRAD